MNRTQIKCLLLACGAMVLLSSQGARAGELGTYLRVDGGANFAEDPSLDVQGTPGKLRLETGFRAGAAVGYYLNKWAGVEFESGFFYNSAESVTLGNQSRHLDDTWLEGVPLLGNVVLRYENSTPLVPYASAGAGGVVSILGISGDTDTAVVFAYQIKAGVVYKLDDRAWLDFGYKFLAANDADFEIGGLKIKSSDLRSHYVGVGVIWKF